MPIAEPISELFIDIFKERFLLLEKAEKLEKLISLLLSFVVLIALMFQFFIRSHCFSRPKLNLLFMKFILKINICWICSNNKALRSSSLYHLIHTCPLKCFELWHLCLLLNNFFD